LSDVPLKHTAELADNPGVARLLVKADALLTPVALLAQDAGQETRFVWAAMARSAPAQARTQATVRVNLFDLRNKTLFTRPV
jgi:hypothetical protein